MFSDSLRIFECNEEARYYSELKNRIPVLEALVKEQEVQLEEKDKEITQLKAMLEKQYLFAFSFHRMVHLRLP